MVYQTQINTDYKLSKLFVIRNEKMKQICNFEEFATGNLSSFLDRDTL